MCDADLIFDLQHEVEGLRMQLKNRDGLLQAARFDLQNLQAQLDHAMLALCCALEALPEHEIAVPRAYILEPPKLTLEGDYDMRREAHVFRVRR